MRCLLFFQSNNSVKLHQQNGFTLIELLVVITLLAIVAGMASLGYEGVQAQGRYDTTRFEMAEIRKALIQFRKDSGTRSFPTQGSYECSDVINGGDASEANSSFDFPDEAGTTDAQKLAWCDHKANFWMLFNNPFNIITHPEKQWNRDTKRGWNGPYLQRKDGYLSLTSNSIGLNNINVNNPIWGISDSYITKPEKTGVEWSLGVDTGILNQAGSPYILEDLDDNDRARIVSAGENGIFDSPSTDPCVPPTDDNGNSIDHALCLLK